MSRPEIRIDQLTGARVVLAPARSERPDQFRPPEAADPVGPEGCPFCEGREEKTPAELFATRPPGSPADSPGWSTRVVPNLYPVLGPGDDGDEGDDGDRERPQSAYSSPADPLLASARSGEPDLFGSRPALGSHEVLINTPRHVTTLGELTGEELGAAVATWRERMRANRDAPYVQLIVNQGPDSGASLEHTHAQLYGLPFVPAEVARERERFNAYRERTAGGSLLGEVLREEIRRGERLVAIDEEAALICPWASRSPMEMRIVPRSPQPSFESEEAGTAGAAMLRLALKALEERVGRLPQLNLWVRTAPRGVEHFHWHIDIVPRLTRKAAFEFGTGVEIDVLSPEVAAAALREAVDAIE